MFYLGLLTILLSFSLVHGSGPLLEHSTIKPDDSVRSKLFQMMSPTKDYTYLLLIESIPAIMLNRCEMAQSPYDIRLFIDKVIYPLFSWSQPEEKEFLEEMFWIMSDVLHLKHSSFYRLSFNAELFADKLRELPLQASFEGAGKSFVDCYRLLSSNMNTNPSFMSHDYLKYEYEWFRPHLYALNPITAGLTYDCKLFTADLLSKPVRGKMSSVYVKFFTHPAFNEHTADILRCVHHMGAADEMEMYMRKYEREQLSQATIGFKDVPMRRGVTINRSKMASGGAVHDYEDDTFGQGHAYATHSNDSNDDGVSGLGWENGGDDSMFAWPESSYSSSGIESDESNNEYY